MFGGGEVTAGGGLAEEIELDLGLGAGRAHGEGAAIGEIDEDHFLLRDEVTFLIEDILLGEVANPGHGRAIDFGGWLGGVGFGERLDFRRAIRAFHDERLADFEVIAVFGVNRIEDFGNGLADGFRVGGHFGKHEGRAVGILVPHRIRSEIAITLLAAEDEEARVFEAQQPGLLLGERTVVALLVGGNGILVFAELAGDVFETGERVHDAHAEAIGDGALEFGGDEGFDEHRAAAVGVGEPAEIEAGFQAIPRHERADLVAGEELHRSGGVADGHAHAVGVRIGADDDLGSGFLGEIDGHLQGRGVFRIRRLHGGEAAVLDVLLGHGEHFESEAAEHRHVDGAAGAVQIGEDHLGGRAFEQLRLEQQGLEPLDVAFIHFAAEHGDGATLAFRKRFVGFGNHRVHLGDDAGGVRIDDLGTVVEVGLEAIVMRRVVRGG